MSQLILKAGCLHRLVDHLLDATEAACWRVLGIESKGDK